MLIIVIPRGVDIIKTYKPLYAARPSTAVMFAGVVRAEREMQLAKKRRNDNNRAMTAHVRLRRQRIIQMYRYRV